MKASIAILILLGVLFVGWKLFEYSEKIQNEKAYAEETAQRAKNVDPHGLEGMAPELEASLSHAYAGGPRALKAWLAQNQKAKKIKDPRLAWVELDYVVMASSDDPVDAKRVFGAVKSRLSPKSPVYPRLKDLEKTYE